MTESFVAVENSPSAHILVPPWKTAVSETNSLIQGQVGVFKEDMGPKSCSLWYPASMYQKKPGAQGVYRPRGGPWWCSCPHPLIPLCACRHARPARGRSCALSYPCRIEGRYICVCVGNEDLCRGATVGFWCLVRALSWAKIDTKSAPPHQVPHALPRAPRTPHFENNNP